MTTLWDGRVAAALLLAFGAGATAAEPAGAAAAPLAAPLAVRNLSPVHQLFGLPRPLGARRPSGTPELALRVEHGNNFSASVDGGTVAFFDGSTTVTSLSVRSGWRDGLEWGVEVPLVRHDGGFTDGFIDGWHDVFGLPEGGRDSAPRNRLDYHISYAGAVRADLDSARQELGDVRAWLGLGLLEGPGRRAALRATVKLPTGDTRELSGSGAADLSLSAELVDYSLLESLGLTLTLMGGITLPGDNDLLPGADRAAVPVGHLGVHYPLGGRLVLRGQVDAHGDLLDAGVPQLGEAAVLGTLGGTVRVTRSAWLDLGVTEDLTGQSAPDVIFQLSLGVSL